MSASQPRQNYHAESEAAINKQINLELYASYVYMSMAWYFDRDDVALPGFHKFFLSASREEQEHADKLMKLQNQRGGRIVLHTIQKPERDDWTSGAVAMQTYLDLEKNINQSLLDVTDLANNHNDAQLSDFIATEFLTEQVEAIKMASNYVATLKRIGPGLGEYQFDRETLKGSDS